MLLTAIFLFVFLEETNFDRSAALAVVTENQVANQVGDDKNVTRASIAPVNDDHLDHKSGSYPEVAEVGQGDGEHVVHSYDRLVSPWPGPRPFRLFKVSPNWRGLMWRGILYPLAMLRLPIILW